MSMLMKLCSWTAMRSLLHRHLLHPAAASEACSPDDAAFKGRLRSQLTRCVLMAEVCDFADVMLVEPCRKSYGTDSCFVHDPTAFAAVIRSDLFSWQPSKVLVLKEGIACGMTIMDHCIRNWVAPNEWSERPIVQVAVGVQATKMVPLLLERMAL